jgi:hypothetical protein
MDPRILGHRVDPPDSQILGARRTLGYYYERIPGEQEATFAPK